MTTTVVVPVQMARPLHRRVLAWAKSHSREPGQAVAALIEIGLAKNLPPKVAKRKVDDWISRAADRAEERSRQKMNSNTPE